MIRIVLAAPLLLGALLLAAPATAQTAQEQLDARYDRALAAGYKALMLCSAIANAEANRATRTPESVIAWELAGIQAPLDAIIADLPYDLHATSGSIHLVSVEWAEDMPPRYAQFRGAEGCSLFPVGSTEPRTLRYRKSGGFSWWSRQFDGSAEIFVSATKPELLSEGDSLKLAPIDAAFDGRSYGTDSRTTAVLLAKSGVIVSERYAPDFGPYVPQRTWSVAKSLAASIIGAAQQRGEANVAASAGLGVDLDDPRRKITIDDLLRMASGLYSDTPGNRTDPLYWGGATVDEVALDWPLVARPGSTYRYANNDTLAAIAAIKSTFGAHPPAAFFNAVGMNKTVAETDWQGNYVLSSQVWTTARDMATFGQLYLNDGTLPDGTRILPEGWVKYVATPSGPQPDGEFGYGAGFWLLNKSGGVPPGTFAAFGNRGQYVVIVPSRGVVIVRRGEDPAGTRFDIAAFTRDVLAALDRSGK